MKKSKLILIVFSSFTLFQFLLISKNQIPLSIDEAERYLSAKTINTNGNSLFPVPTFYLIPFSLSNNTIYQARIPQLLAGLFLLLTMWLLMQKMAGKILKEKLIFIYLALIIVISPWLQSLILFHLPETLSLIFFCLAIIILIKITEDSDNKKHWILLEISMLLFAFSSWPGLIVSFIFPIFIFLFFRKTFRQYVLFFTLILFAILGVYIIKNFNHIRIFTLENTFINQITPKKLAEEINDRQKIDFLASNRQFILPNYVRKFIYNKPFLAFEKTFKKTVSFFDFEQFAYPSISYDITSLSGILPKGNLPLGYFWEIPLLFLGLYAFLTQKNRYKTLIILIPLLLLPSLFFEKRDLLTTGFLVVPFLLFLEIYGLHQILKISKALPKTVFKAFSVTLLVLIILTIYEQYKLIYLNKFSYQTSDLYFYKEIAKSISSEKDNFSKIVVTDRIGPTNLMAAFYLDTPPEKLERLEFRPISFPQENVSENTLFIGLPGEFTKPGEYPNDLPLPSNLTLINEIVAPDELVYHYGKNIWMVTSKQ